MGKVIANADGSFNVPEYSLEATQRQILEQLSKLTNGSAKASSSMESLFGLSSSDLADAADSLGEVAAAIPKANNKLLSRMTGTLKSGLGGLGSGILGVLKISLKGLGSMLGLSIPAMKALFSDVVNTFSDLSQVGVNTGDVLTNIINGYQELGITMSATATNVKNNAMAFAVLNKKGIMATVKLFNTLAKSGSKYGITVERVNELLLDELNFRAGIARSESISAKQRADNAEELFKVQMSQTRMLGKDIDQIRKSAQELIKRNANVYASVARLGTAGEETLAGLSAFASGLSAAGFSESFTEAMLNAGTAVDVFVDEGVRNFFTAMSAAGVNMEATMRDMADVISTGQFDTAKAQSTINDYINHIDSINEEGVYQLQVLAQAGNQEAAEILKMRQMVKEARKNLMGSGQTVDSFIQQITETDAGFKQFSGAFELFRVRIMHGLLPVIKMVSDLLSNEGLASSISEAGMKIGNALNELFSSAESGGIQGLIKWIEELGNEIVTWVKSLSEINGEKASLKEIFNKMGEDIGQGLMGGIMDAISWKTVAAWSLGLLGTGAAIGALSAALGKIPFGSVLAGFGKLLIIIGGVELAIAGLGLALGTFSIIIDSVTRFRRQTTKQMQATNENIRLLSEVPKGKLESLASELTLVAEAMEKLGKSISGSFFDKVKGFFTDSSPMGTLITDLQKLQEIDTAKVATNLGIISDIQRGKPISVEFKPAAVTPVATSTTGNVTQYEIPTKPSTAVSTPTDAIQANQKKQETDYSSTLPQILDAIRTTNRKLESLERTIINTV